MDNKVFNNLELEERFQLNEILDREEMECVERYVSELENEINSLERERDDLQERCNDLEIELEDTEYFNPCRNFLNELVNDRYFTLRKTYTSLDKVLDKAEFVLKYGD